MTPGAKVSAKPYALVAGVNLISDTLVGEIGDSLPTRLIIAILAICSTYILLTATQYTGELHKQLMKHS
jgi:hypothetical protein